MPESRHADAVLSEAAEALFRLGRLFTKVGLPGASGQHNVVPDLSRILVVQAIETIHSHGEQRATVGAVAQQLAIDPSTASRLVADALKDGYLVRSVSQTDNRRVLLELSEQGHNLGRDARAYQRGVFEQVTQDWTEHERQEFARLFVRFADAVAVSLQTSQRPDNDS